MYDHNEMFDIKVQNQINLGACSGQIEESYGRRRFFVSLDSSGILEYEKRILAEGTHYTLPMNFLEAEGKETVSYDYTGFMQMEEYIKYRQISQHSGRNESNMINDFLKMISNIMDGLKGLEDYLISCDRMSVTKETVFIDPNYGTIAFAFIPAGISLQPLQSRLILLIEQMNIAYNEPELSPYVKRLKDTILQNNMGLDGMIGSIGMIQREVSYIQWSNTDFRIGEDEQKQNLISNEVKASTDIHGVKSLFKDLTGERKKFVLVQAAIIVTLILLYFSGIFHITDYIGFCVIAAGVDLWLVKSVQFKKSIE